MFIHATSLYTQWFLFIWTGKWLPNSTAQFVLPSLLCISGWLSVRNRQCLCKQDPTSHAKSCTSIYSTCSFEKGNGLCIYNYSSLTQLIWNTHFAACTLTTNLQITAMWYMYVGVNWGIHNIVYTWISPFSVLVNPGPLTHLVLTHHVHIPYDPNITAIENGWL